MYFGDPNFVKISFRVPLLKELSFMLLTKSVVLQ